MTDCSKSNTCVNRGRRCRECWANSSQHDEYPCYEERSSPVKFAIFFGNSSATRADSKLNAWLSQNRNVQILSYQYQQARMGDHSICVMYTETQGA